ncbi:MAG: FUN14 domain-containing protein [Phycisphaerales bacterium]|nr:FUN14 domain-containing protein [Phycisphaerales bacterium]
MTKPAASAESATASAAAMPMWKIITLVVSGIVAASGLGLMVYSGVTAPERPAATAPEGPGELDPGASGFLPGQPRPTDPGADPDPVDEEDRWLDDYSPAIFRLGFAFFVGFALGYALKTFMKIVVIIAGVLLFTLLGLEHMEWISVNWDEVRGGYDSAAGWAQAQFASFGDFVKGAVPSTASAIGGLAVALKK